MGDRLVSLIFPWTHGELESFPLGESSGSWLRASAVLPNSFQKLWKPRLFGESLRKATVFSLTQRGHLMRALGALSACTPVAPMIREQREKQHKGC